MGFYKNTGATKDIKAQIFAEKIIRQYKENSNPNRQKARKYRERQTTGNIISPLYIARTQRPSDLGTNIVNPFRNGEDRLKEYLMAVLKEGFFIKYKDLLKNRWYYYSVTFDTSSKK